MHSIVQDTTELEIAKAEAGRASQAREKLTERAREMELLLDDQKLETAQVRRELEISENDSRQKLRERREMEEELRVAKKKFSASTQDAEISRKVLQATTAKLMRAIPDDVLEKVTGRTSEGCEDASP